MQKPTIIILSVFSLFGIALAGLSIATVQYGTIEKPRLGSFPIPQARLVSQTHPAWEIKPDGDVKPLPAYLEKSLEWLAQAQAENGGWGAGLHSMQNVRDPKSVQIDPATTAYVAMALLRAGNTLNTGPYSQQLVKATNCLLQIVNDAPQNHMNITTVTGTQPQQKLGQNIDVAMTVQYFARLMPYIQDDQVLSDRVGNAMDFCIQRLQGTQMADGSWNAAGWAPVLNSAMANNALELSEQVGRKVDIDALEKSRQYQSDNVRSDDAGGVATDKAAGIQLYALASAQRATANDAKVVKEAMVESESPASAAPVLEEVVVVMEKKGYSKKEAKRMASSYISNQKAGEMLQRDDVLSGFGNNGGEEFLSYMMTSESLVATDDKEWNNWHKRMEGLFEKIQNPDGSWSGHHCITSPVFCTAAVIMTLGADRDALVLKAEKKKPVKQ
ncbi:MAG: hypothetical protein HUU01_11605 [Saprospiraceae bacterium]|nr:hypothetical protein [Saprospiraceae bacterium]